VARQVLLYNGRTQQLERQITRFKDIAYSGCYRIDGRLVVAGGETGVVQLFDTGSRNVLRQFKGHQRPVHVARFSPDKLHVLSGGDDATVRPLAIAGSIRSIVPRRSWSWCEARWY